MRAERGRKLKQLPPVSSDLDLESSPIIESAVQVASSEDLLIAILLHVPTKTLLGFKTVSKQWLSLIANPRFIHLHHPLRPSASALFYAIPCRSNPDHQFIPLEDNHGSLPPFKTLNFIHGPLGSGISALQSCNGLLLCASYRAHDLNRIYYVYNPTTRQFATLPPIKREHSETVYGMSLAFDPTESCYYKVVCVRRSEISHLPLQIEIYSSETRFWRISGQPFIAPMYKEFQNCIYWNGSIHWWNGFVQYRQWRDGPYSLYFKVEKERIEQLAMPMKHITVATPYSEDPETYSEASYVGESEGHWHLIEVYYDSTCLYNVYEMARDYSFASHLVLRETITTDTKFFNHIC